MAASTVDRQCYPAFSGGELTHAALPGASVAMLTGCLYQLVGGVWVAATDAAGRAPAWVYLGEGIAASAAPSEKVVCHQGVTVSLAKTADIGATSYIGGAVYVVDNYTVGIDSTQTDGAAEVTNNALAGAILGVDPEHSALVRVVIGHYPGVTAKLHS